MTALRAVFISRKAISEALLSVVGGGMKYVMFSFKVYIPTPLAKKRIRGSGSTNHLPHGTKMKPYEFDYGGPKSLESPKP